MKSARPHLPSAKSKECAQFIERLGAYVDRTLGDEECNGLEAHLRGCRECRQAVGRFAAVQRLLRGTLNVETMPPASRLKTGQRLGAILADSRSANMARAELEETPILEVEGEESFAGSVRERFGAAPWWVVSVMLHGLVILLAGLISMAVKLPAPEDAVVMVTELAPRPQIKAEEEKKRELEKSVLASKHETPPTDPTSKEMNDIVVPPEILAKAELGDHFETINPDRPDTQSAFGNPEAHMFHSVQGNDEPEGGGGTGGATLDDMIGVGGAGSPGTGGGWGGGNGTGIGVGTGSGRGSFGNRNGGGRKLMVKRHGGSKATEGAVDGALRWLAYHQEPDGRWDCDKYLSNKATRYGTPDSPKYDPGVSGLALLAFLGAGHSLKVGEYKDNVQRAVKWFLSQQGADGDFTFKSQPCTSGAMMYGHCIATLACAEALGMNNGKDWGNGNYSGDKGDKSLRAAVELGIQLILKWQEQNQHGGWSYAFGGVSGTPAAVVSALDPTATGWAVMALKAAKVAGIAVPAQSFMRATEGLKTLCDHNKNQGDYGRSLVGYRAHAATLFNSKGYACTAAGAVTWLFCGAPVTDDHVAGCASLITQDDALPAWTFTPQNTAMDHQNLYYWYYGTLACFQAGGDYWAKWNEKMKTALVTNQCKQGDDAGSWNPDDVWGAWGGRVYSTALGALCLEVYYRYMKLSPDAK